jgi:LysM repeat protein
MYDRAAMVGRSRARRNPARYLAPLALAATLASLYLILDHALRHGTASANSQTTQSTPTLSTPTHQRHSGGHKRSSASTHAKYYTVKPGDSLSSIATKTGVSVLTLESLNHHLNPNALQVGQRLRLRR